MKNLDKEVEALLTPSEEFTEKKKELLNSLKQEPSKEVVKQYADRYHLTSNEAKKRLAANYQKEIDSVEHKEIALRLSNAYKTMAPKFMGMEMRERDREALSRKSASTAQRALARVQELEDSITNAAKDSAEKHILKTLGELDLPSLIRALQELEERIKVLERDSFLTRIVKAVKMMFRR